MAASGDRVPDLGEPNLLHPGDQITDLAGLEFVDGARLRRHDADLVRLHLDARRHERDLLARTEPAIDDSDVSDDATVGVVDGVEHQGAQRRALIPVGRRDLLDDVFEQRFDTLACLGRDPVHVAEVTADQLSELFRVFVGLRGGEIDLVEDRDDLKSRVDCQVEVGEGLGLDALSGVHQKQNTVAGGQ